MKLGWAWAVGTAAVIGCGPDGATADGDGGSGGESAEDDGTSVGADSTGAVDDAADTTSAIDDSDSEGSSESGEAVSLCLHRAPLDGIEATRAPLVVADVDGDKRPELWIRSQEWDPANEVLTQHLTAYSASPDGSTMVIADATFEGSFERFADIDGDGRDDVVARPMARAETWFWLAGQADATFAADPQPLSSPPASAHWHDAEGDGDVDVFEAYSEEPGFAVGVALWRGDGSGDFVLSGSVPIDTQGFVTDVVATAEPGVLIVDADNGALGFGIEAAYWRLTVAADGTLSTSAHTDQTPQELRVAHDLDGDGVTDLLVWQTEEEQIRAWRATDAAYEETVIGDGHEAYAGDFLADGGVQVLLFGAGGQATLLHAPLDPAGEQTPVDGALDPGVLDEIDIDGDGRTELLQQTFDGESGYAIVEIVACE